jgi:hypothetical protein
MMLSRHLKTGENRNIKTANSSFEIVDKFKYLGTIVTNRNLFQEEIKRRLNSGNACYDSFQKLLPSRLLCKNVENRVHKTIILPLVLYVCETWSLILREEHRLRVWRIFVILYCSILLHFSLAAIIHRLTWNTTFHKTYHLYKFKRFLSF